MLVGLISDTHIDRATKTLPPQIKDAFRGVELILHAGDIWVPSVLDELSSIAPVKAAWGDDDMEDDLGGDSRMMEGYTIHVNGTTIWLTHEKPRYRFISSDGALYSPTPSLDNPEKLEDPPDVLVFGHTHQAAIERYQGVLMVNPGSPTMPDYVPVLGSVALLMLDAGKVDVRIVHLGKL